MHQTDIDLIFIIEIWLVHHDLQLYVYMYIPSFDVRWREVDLSVKSPRSEEGGVKHVWSVGTSKHYNINSRVEAYEERV